MARKKTEAKKPRVSSRNKGAAGEREFAGVLRDHGLAETIRGQQHAGGPDSPDVRCPGLPHIHFEVKRVEAGNPYKWLEQAIRDAGPGKAPVVAHRKNNQDWIAIVPMEIMLRWLILIEKHHAELEEQERDPDGLD